MTASSRRQKAGLEELPPFLPRDDERQTGQEALM